MGHYFRRPWSYSVGFCVNVNDKSIRCIDREIIAVEISRSPVLVEIEDLDVYRKLVKLVLKWIGNNSILATLQLHRDKSTTNMI